MIEPANTNLSIGKQCKLLSISRSSFYYQPKGETAVNLILMRQIDEQFLETPFFGVRQMTWHLPNESHLVNERRIRRLMRLMGLMPIYQKPNTSKAAKGHKTYPYLLKGLRVTRPNQVWAADITYLPMRRGFLYLVAIMDWHTRKVLACRISNTLEADFCVEALNEAIARFGPLNLHALFVYILTVYVQRLYSVMLSVLKGISASQRNSKRTCLDYPVKVQNVPSL